MMNFLLGVVAVMVGLWIYASWVKARRFNTMKRELIKEIEHIRRVMAQTEFNSTERPMEVRVSRPTKVKAKKKAKAKKKTK